MRTISLVVIFLIGMIVPGFAQKADIEAVNARWTEYFNKGDFAGVASLSDRIPTRRCHGERQSRNWRNVEGYG